MNLKYSQTLLFVELGDGIYEINAKIEWEYSRLDGEWFPEASQIDLTLNGATIELTPEVEALFLGEYGGKSDLEALLIAETGEEEEKDREFMIFEYN